MKESELVLASNGNTPYHVPLSYDTLADNVVLVGDPNRVEMFKNVFESVEYEASTREIHALTGRYHGNRVTALSTGMGCDNIDIVMTELDVIANFDLTSRSLRQEHRSLRLLRIGTCGSLQPHLECGSLVASRYAIGIDGLMNYYQYDPAKMETELTHAFLHHMQFPSSMATPYAVSCSQQLMNTVGEGLQQGITVTAPGFYGPQGRHIRLAPAMADFNERLAHFAWNGVAVANLEMESSAIFAFAKQLGHDALTVCLIIANRPTGKFLNSYHNEMAEAIGMLVERLAI